MSYDHKLQRLNQLLGFTDFYNRSQQEQWERIRTDNHPLRACLKSRGLYAYGALPGYHYMGSPQEILSWEELAYYSIEQGWNGLSIMLTDYKPAPLLAAEQLMTRYLSMLLADLQATFSVSNARIYYNGLMTPSFLIIFNNPDHMIRAFRAIMMGDLMWRLFYLKPQIVGIPYRFQLRGYEMSYPTDIRKARHSFKIPRMNINQDALDDIAPADSLVYFLRDSVWDGAFGKLISGKFFVASPLRYQYYERHKGFKVNWIFRIVEGPHEVTELVRDHQGEEGYEHQGPELTETLETEEGFNNWIRDQHQNVQSRVTDSNLSSEGRQMTGLERAYVRAHDAPNVKLTFNENAFNSYFVDGAFIARMESFQPTQKRLVARSAYEIVYGNAYRLVTQDGVIPTPQSVNVMGDLPIQEIRPQRLPSPPPTPVRSPQFETPARQLLQEQRVPSTSQQPQNQGPQFPVQGSTPQILLEDLTGDTPQSLRSFARYLGERAQRMEQAQNQESQQAMEVEQGEVTGIDNVTLSEQLTNLQSDMIALPDTLRNQFAGHITDAIKATLPDIVRDVMKESTKRYNDTITRVEANREVINRVDQRVAAQSAAVSNLTSEVRSLMGQRTQEPKVTKSAQANPITGKEAQPSTYQPTEPTKEDVNDYMNRYNYLDIHWHSKTASRNAQAIREKMDSVLTFIEKQQKPALEQQQVLAKQIISAISQLRTYYYGQTKLFLEERNNQRAIAQEHYTGVRAHRDTIDEYLNTLNGLVLNHQEFGQQFLLSDVREVLDALQRGLRHVLPEVFDRHAQLFQHYAIQQRATFTTEVRSLIQDQLRPQQDAFIPSDLNTMVPTLGNPFRPVEPPQATSGRTLGQSGLVDQFDLQAPPPSSPVCEPFPSLSVGRTQGADIIAHEQEMANSENQPQSQLPSEWTENWSARQLDQMRQNLNHTLSADEEREYQRLLREAAGGGQDTGHTIRQQNAQDNAIIGAKITEALQRTTQIQSTTPQEDPDVTERRILEESERTALEQQPSIPFAEQARQSNQGTSSRQNILQLPAEDRLQQDPPVPESMLPEHQSDPLRKSRSMPSPNKNGAALRSLIQSGFEDQKTHLGLATQQQSEHNQQIMNNLAEILKALQIDVDKQPKQKQKRNRTAAALHLLGPVQSQTQKQRRDPARGSFPARHTRQADRERQDQQRQEQLSKQRAEQEARMAQQTTAQQQQPEQDQQQNQPSQSQDPEV